MRLFIAEKPSLARAIAAVLPLPQRRYREHIQCGEGNVVGWCAGHILEPVMPEHYDRKFARWDLADLPIVPGDWKLRASVPALVSSLKMLLRGAARVVHAGDPDREGQLLVDEILDFLGYPGPVERILLRDLSPEAVRRALDALEPNDKYRPLGRAALGRQRADWLYGINMTRLYSLLGQAAGYTGRVLSIGRVQTPLLGLVVARDAAIQSFQRTPYYVVSATARTASGESFEVRWSTEGLAPPDVDEEGRLLSEAIALSVVERTAGAQGLISSVARETKTEPAALPYSLAHLQIDAARRLGLSAQAVLDACQALYEKHGLVTYPRSDCSHLPKGQLGDAKEVLEAIARCAPDLAGLVGEADVSRRSRAWNDGKVTAHHAIIPTKGSASTSLGNAERAIYDLVARRYVSQFLASHVYAQMRVELEAAASRFVATGRETTVLGWRKAMPGATDGDEQNDAPPPGVREGDTVTLAEVLASAKETQPPKAFTDATLMQAMVNVGAYVSDPRVKAILSESDGIGTPATRPAIIETLFERGYLERSGKSIVSTAIGRALVASLPVAATAPDMTAEWEAAMRAIAESSETVEGFLERITVQLGGLISEGKTRRIAPPPPPAPPSRAARQRDDRGPKRTPRASRA
jgi:DNA topoisomerase-3